MPTTDRSRPCHSRSTTVDRARCEQGSVLRGTVAAVVVLGVLAAVIATVQRVARAVKAAFAADGLTIFQYNEPAGGQTVFHLHVHIVPRHDGVALKRHEGGMADKDRLAEHAERIRAALGAG